MIMADAKQGVSPTYCVEERLPDSLNNASTSRRLAPRSSRPRVPSQCCVPCLPDRRAPSPLPRNPISLHCSCIQSKSCETSGVKKRETFQATDRLEDTVHVIPQSEKNKRRLETAVFGCRRPKEIKADKRGPRARTSRYRDAVGWNRLAIAKWGFGGGASGYEAQNLKLV
jgi:hypothetical protein